MKTPQFPYPALAAALDVPAVWLKREDLHHFGSHKGRSIPSMMDHYIHKDGVTDFVISSSGNAALAAALATTHHNENNPTKPITLTIFVGQNIAAKKMAHLTTLANGGIKIEQVANPKQQAFQLEKSGAAKFLRQSTDDLALVGYQELARELDHIPNLAAIFVPTSSGTTAQALGEAFAKLSQKPQIHIVQTSAVHPIVNALPTSAPSAALAETDESIAGAIVDKIAHRKASVVAAVLDSNGAGWIVSDDEIRTAIALVKKTTEIDISPNSALSVAGLAQARRQGWSVDGTVVCVITGA